MSLFTRILLVCAVVGLCWCQDYEQEDRPIVRTRQARGPSLPRSLPRQNLLSKSTTTTTEAPLEEEEYTDEELQEGELIEDEPQTTTTEAPKKPLRGVVRPFRSNEELIEALKRRRAQAGGRAPPGNYPTTSTTSTEPTPRASSAGRKAKSNSRFAPRGQTPRTTEQPQASTEEQTRPRLYSARGNRRF